MKVKVRKGIKYFFLKDTFAPLSFYFNYIVVLESILIFLFGPERWWSNVEQNKDRGNSVGSL